MRRRFSIRSGSEPLAEYEKTAEHEGTLRFPDASFAWRHTDAANAEYGWFAGDSLLLTMRPRATGAALAEVTVVQRDHPSVPLLAPFGLYLFILAEGDTAIVRLRIP